MIWKQTCLVLFLQCSSPLRCRSSNSANCCLDVDESAEYGINHSVYMTVNSAPPHSHLSHHIISLSFPSIVLRQLFRSLLRSLQACLTRALPHVCSVMVSWSACVAYPLSQQAAVAAVDFDMARFHFAFVFIYAYFHLFLTCSLFLVSLANLCALYNV